MDKSLLLRIERIASKLFVVTERLRFLGYEFDRPDEVMPGVEPNTLETIAQIEQAIGVVPKALKEFWLTVGSIDLSGSHPEWEGCEYPDPLVVFPPSYALYELDEYLEDKEARDREGFPFAIPIAPDYFHKENVSGGPPYSVSVPAIADDPPLNDESHAISFVEYLELSLRYGGFVRLESCAEHTWPVDSILASSES